MKEIKKFLSLLLFLTIAVSATCNDGVYKRFFKVRGYEKLIVLGEQKSLGKFLEIENAYDMCTGWINTKDSPDDFRFCVLFTIDEYNFNKKSDTYDKKIPVVYIIYVDNWYSMPESQVVSENQIRDDERIHRQNEETKAAIEALFGYTASNNEKSKTSNIPHNLVAINNISGGLERVMLYNINGEEFMEWSDLDSIKVGYSPTFYKLLKDEHKRILGTDNCDWYK